jgi:hypothetical protein
MIDVVSKDRSWVLMMGMLFHCFSIAVWSTGLQNSSSVCVGEMVEQV